MSKLKDKNELEKLVVQTMQQVAEEQCVELVDELHSKTVLLESGLDSLGFATLVVHLEMELDIDPFAESDDAYYPSTLGDFIDFYWKALHV